MSEICRWMNEWCEGKAYHFLFWPTQSLQPWGKTILDMLLFAYTTVEKGPHGRPRIALPPSTPTILHLRKTKYVSSLECSFLCAVIDPPNFETEYMVQFYIDHHRVSVRLTWKISLAICNFFFTSKRDLPFPQMKSVAPSK